MAAYMIAVVNITNPKPSMKEYAVKAAALIKQHGGQIDVKSTPGEGAEFVITLPLKQSV